MTDATFCLGLDRIADQFPQSLRKARIGLLMNRASVDVGLRHASEVIAEHFPGQLHALFTPQHGLWGDVQANMVETDHGWHRDLGVPIYSLYSETRRPTVGMLSNIDSLVIDLQDVGTRVYTYIWTLLECMRACAETDVGIVVLDRPNPIGGKIVEGPLLDTGFFSFVGGAQIPMRHALTFGEMGQFFCDEFEIDVDLRVLPMAGWRREQTFDQLGRHWIPPSPNLPRVESALVYPGQVLLEGTNLSEGRGTTTPFEMIGAPFISPDRLINAVNGYQLPGVRFLPINFRPTFDKWSGQLCGGVSIHITDLDAFRSYQTTVTLIRVIQNLWPDDFAWLPPPYEYETVKPPIDIISGDGRMREGTSMDDLCRVDLHAWQERTQNSLIYGPVV
jgi:uncharacterized protein YbbC (DUF1343 family)